MSGRRFAHICAKMATKRRFDWIFLCNLHGQRVVLAEVVSSPALVLVACLMATVTVRALTLPESIPDFSLDTSRPGVQSVQTGSWSSPSTWQGGQVPTSNHVVRILQGHTVTINDTAAVAYTIAIDGKLAFAPTVNTRLRVTNLQVMAGEMGMGTPGVLEVGTAASPIAAGVTAEIVIANSPLGGSVADPLQFGTGLIDAGQGVDARQREDADLRAPRHRAARGPHHVDAVGSGRRDGGSATGSSCRTRATSRKAK